MTKIRDVLSDDKRDWELRVAAVSGPQRPVPGAHSHFFLFSS